MELNQEKRKAMDSPVEWFDLSLVEKRVRFSPPLQRHIKRHIICLLRTYLLIFCLFMIMIFMKGRRLIHGESKYKY